jgi:receptor protein-tyrosine kinase
MTDDRAVHLVERAVERMAELGIARPQADPGTAAPRPSRSAPPGGGQGAFQPEPPTSENADFAAATGVGMSTLEAAGMVVGGATRSRVAEEWNVTSGRLVRSLRAIRRKTLANATANLLLVTSSKPNEGKSFSAINLAASLTLGRASEVILVDLDSKPGALTELFGLRDRKGIFDLVADPGLRPETLLVPTAIPGFTFLPIGHAADGGPASAARSITRPAVAAVEAVARRFSNRVIILDTAPCLATSDASTLAGAVAQIAMIVEAERTQYADVEAALELLRPCQDITLVLNKVRQATTHAFGDYDYYNG